MRRLAMIGIDAGELSLLERWRASLPHLARALDQGSPHRLRSPADVLTGSVWPTFATGASPGVHGLYHHLQWDPSRMGLRRASASWLDFEPFWRDLERSGVRPVVCDVPMNTGPRAAAGVEVANWGPHDRLGRLATRPQGLAREVRRRFGEHPMGIETPVTHTERELRRIHSTLVDGAARKTALSRYLLAQGGWDLFVTVYGESHRGGHIFWPPEGDGGDGRLLAVYEAIDAGVGELLEDLRREPDVTVVLFALHGMGPNLSQEHLVPAVMDRVNAAYAGRGPARPPRPQKSLARVLRERLPARLQDAVARAVPVWVRDAVVDRTVSAGHHWPSTPGFAVLADQTGYLRLNRAGRERDGWLPAGSQEEAAYARWVEECFAGLRDAGSGAPLVGALRAVQQEMPGPRSHLLPDLVVTWSGQPAARRAASAALGIVEVEPATGRPGNHRAEGFCLVLGDRAAFGAPGHVQDLAGCVRAFFGAAAPP